jgi:hypothetical protein
VVAACHLQKTQAKLRLTRLRHGHGKRGVNGSVEAGPRLRTGRKSEKSAVLFV